MLQKILATSVLVTLLASTVLAQVETMSAPGQSLPVESETAAEETLILNSAPSEPAELTLSEITVEPETNEAVISFSTSEETHVVIEYGLTPDYERSISTEPQVEHLETLGELLPCATYYYRVHIGEVSREGDFKTLCPVIKPVAKKVVQKAVVQKVAPVAVPEEMNNEQGIMNNEEEIVLNAAPEEVKDEEISIIEQAVPVEVIDEETPETPVQPAPIAPDDMQTPSNDVPVVLLLLAILSGMVVVLFSFKKKKWYQK